MIILMTMMMMIIIMTMIILMMIIPPPQKNAVSDKCWQMSHNFPFSLLRINHIFPFTTFSTFQPQHAYCIYAKHSYSSSHFWNTGSLCLCAGQSASSRAVLPWLTCSFELKVTQTELNQAMPNQKSQSLQHFRMMTKFQNFDQILKFQPG